MRPLRPPALSRRRLLQSAAATGLVGCGTAARGPSGRAGASPAAQGFSMPPEWAPHSGCIMQFPPATNYCFGGSTDCALIQAAREEWAAVARAVARYEPVVLYVSPEDAEVARGLVGGDVTLVEAPLSDGWSRDTAPVFLTHADGRARAACFRFNGWGDSVEHAHDAEVKWLMAADFGVETLDHDMVLEGGAVILDGDGALITTEQCLLHPSRNPDLSQQAQEDILKAWFGVERVVWLGDGWTPDPLTNGHVDGIAACVAPGVVMLNTLDDPTDRTNTAMLADARARLLAAGFELIDLPATSLTAFHINFYVANGAVIVPIEGRASVDDGPLGIIRDAHPGMEVVGVVANTLGEAGGGIHCITQQVPAQVPWPF